MSSNSKSKNTSVPISAAVVAIAILLVTNLWVAGQNNLSRESRLDPHASDALAVSSFFRESKTQPDIGLLGSSLVAVASVQAAAIAKKEPVDRLTHRGSEYFDQALYANLGMKANTACLALGGAMASDAYLLTKHVLNGASAPRAIIYGISPRDFQDNMMFGVETSEAFKLFYQPEDLPDIWRLPRVTPDTKLALTFASISPLWDNRTALSSQIATTALKPVHQFFRTRPQSSAAPPMKIDGPLAPGESVGHPSADHMKEAYLMRYNPLAPSQLRTQFGYLDRLLAMCHKRHVPILVVNMPISEANVAIMPPQLYEYYMMETQRLCRKNSVEFEDLNKAPLNQPSNFLETVHLNPQGSTIFFNALANVVGASAVAQSLSDKNPHYATVNRPGSL
ncbi:MAG: hypothetical protein JST89_18115 [Cyanobacteria bacterium SZAS-4]|nr:hypothetical protein [Cyanobacteria bacterium SZAS-4]